LIRYLLDTNVIWEVRKLKLNGAVLQWLRGLLPEQIFISAVTLGELQAGIERTRRLRHPVLRGIAANARDRHPNDSGQVPGQVLWTIACEALCWWALAA
jgi:predicted nucleic acid-binding protein